jgi:hypothetical protein
VIDKELTDKASTAEYSENAEKTLPPPSELCGLCASSESASGREISLFFVLLLLAGSPLSPVWVKTGPLAGLLFVIRKKLTL